MDKFIDPGFKLHRTCAKLSIHMILNLAESAVLPLTPRHILTEVQNGITALDKSNVPKILNENGAGQAFDLMIKSIKDFNASASTWMEARDNLKKNGKLNDPLRYKLIGNKNFFILLNSSLRMLNDQIMLLERTFLLPQGLPGRSYHRHAIFSPAKFNIYGKKKNKLF